MNKRTNLRFQNAYNKMKNIFCAFNYHKVAKEAVCSAVKEAAVEEKVVEVALISRKC